MTGLAAELSGAMLWMNVAIAIFCWLGGTSPYTSNRSKMKNGLQHKINTEIYYNKIDRSSTNIWRMFSDISTRPRDDPHLTCKNSTRPSHPSLPLIDVKLLPAVM